MTDRPAISAIVPVYNGERYLREALESILAQTLPAAEILVVDDGSTDSSADLAASIAETASVPIRVIRQDNAGAAAARNHGAREATGSLLAFLDADDLWTPDALASNLSRLGTEADMAFGHAQQFISPDLTPEAAARLACPPDPMSGYIPSAMLIRREAFWRIGGFETHWKTAEFVDWYLRAQEQGLTSTLHATVVLRRRLHETNHGVTQRDARGDIARILKAALDRRRAARDA
ncbi:MAG: glycosyltransferase family A protein [Bacteroidota bacterium]